MSADEKLSLIFKKIERANKHLRDFEAHRDLFFAEPDAHRVESYDEPETGNRVFRVVHVKDTPVELALTVGDALHNVRSALDHLTWQLVISNGSTPGQQTMFPFFGTATECVAMKTGKVDGMSQSAKDKIRDAEPYKGGKGHYLWVLNKLDIADKHHALLMGVLCVGETIISPSQPVTEHKAATSVFTANFGTELRFEESLKAGDIFYVLPKNHACQKVEFAFDIGISEPNVMRVKPVVRLLNYLINYTTNLILTFRDDLA